MNFTLKELERVMVVARLIADHCGDLKSDKYKPSMLVSFCQFTETPSDSVMFKTPDSTWIIKSDQFRRGCSPIDIFNEAKKERLK
jgi:hypothetical protein